MGQKVSSRNLTTLFEKTEVYDPALKKNVLFRSIWESNDKEYTFIHWLRRFGCVICRVGAKDLTDDLLKIKKKNNNFKYVAIGISDEGYEEFIEQHYFDNNSIFIDKDYQTHRALGFGRASCWSMWGMLNPKLYIDACKAKKRGITGNFSGDGMQLGGSAIVNKEGKVIWFHKQSTYTDFPKLKEIEEVLNKVK